MSAKLPGGASQFSESVITFDKRKYEIVIAANSPSSSDKLHRYTQYIMSADDQNRCSDLVQGRQHKLNTG